MLWMAKVYAQSIRIMASQMRRTARLPVKEWLEVVEMKLHTIIKDGITIGFFQNQNDRDKAFEKFVVPNSINCMKGDLK